MGYGALWVMVCISAPTKSVDRLSYDLTGYGVSQVWVKTGSTVFTKFLCSSILERIYRRGWNFFLGTETRVILIREQNSDATMALKYTPYLHHAQIQGHLLQ